MCKVTLQMGKGTRTHAKVTPSIFKGILFGNLQKDGVSVALIKQELSSQPPRNPSFKNPATEGVTDAFYFKLNAP